MEDDDNLLNRWPGGWRSAATICVTYGAHGVLSDRERRFARNLLSFPRISPKQRAVLNRLLGIVVAAREQAS
jgi:hypothetical protein